MAAQQPALLPTLLSFRFGAVQALAAAVFSGVLLGYVAYDCMHYLMHRCGFGFMQPAAQCSSAAAATENAAQQRMQVLVWTCVGVQLWIILLGTVKSHPIFGLTLPVRLAAATCEAGCERGTCTTTTRMTLLRTGSAHHCLILCLERSSGQPSGRQTSSWALCNSSCKLDPVSKGMQRQLCDL